MIYIIPVIPAWADRSEGSNPYFLTSFRILIIFARIPSGRTPSEARPGGILTEITKKLKKLQIMLEI